MTSLKKAHSIYRRVSRELGLDPIPNPIALGTSDTSRFKPSEIEIIQSLEERFTAINKAIQDDLREEDLEPSKIQKGTMLINVVLGENYNRETGEYEKTNEIRETKFGS